MYMILEKLKYEKHLFNHPKFPAPLPCPQQPAVPQGPADQPAELHMTNV